MTKTRATVARDHTEASLLINALIRAECGDAPDALDNYEIKVMPATNQGTRGKGKAIVAWPIGSRPTANNIIAVCYDEPGIIAEATRRGYFDRLDGKL